MANPPHLQLGATLAEGPMACQPGMGGIGDILPPLLVASAVSGRGAFSVGDRV
jgi:hypothetical protein